MNRQAIIVLGMHRSGTSAVAGALGMLGMRLPARLMQAAPENPKGFFEPTEIVSIHDRLLASAGSRWFSCRAIPEAWFGSAQAAAYADELAGAAREDYGDAPVFVVKDPRICRLVPLWQAVLAKIGAEGRFVIPLRHPLAVARSLETRNGFPIAYGCALWLRHLLDAECRTRGARRVFVPFEDLLKQPARVAAFVASRLVDDWPPDGVSGRDIGSFVDPGLQHHVVGADETFGAADFDRWVGGAVDAFAMLARDPNDAEAQRRLDEIRQAFGAAMASLAPVMEAAELLIDARARAEAERRSPAHELLHAELGRMTESRDFLQAELGRMTEARDFFQAELGRMTEARDFFQAELGRMTASRDHFRSQVERR